MVSKSGLAKSLGFEPPLCNLFPISLLENLCRTLFGLFDSSDTSMGMYTREDVKGVIFILNLNYRSLNF